MGIFVFEGVFERGVRGEKNSRGGGGTAGMVFYSGALDTPVSLIDTLRAVYRLFLLLAKSFSGLRWGKKKD